MALQPLEIPMKSPWFTAREDLQLVFGAEDSAETLRSILEERDGEG